MKKIILVMMIIIMFASCATTNYAEGKSPYQEQEYEAEAVVITLGIILSIIGGIMNPPRAGL